MGSDHSNKTIFDFLQKKLDYATFVVFLVTIMHFFDVECILMVFISVMQILKVHKAALTLYSEFYFIKTSHAIFSKSANEKIFKIPFSDFPHAVLYAYGVTIWVVMTFN